MDRGNPVGFFGMVYVLEGTSVRVATEAAENLKLRAEAQGWIAADSDPISLGAGQESEGITIRLLAGGTVSGRVLGADGAPLRSAEHAEEDRREPEQ